MPQPSVDVATFQRGAMFSSSTVDMVDSQELDHCFVAAFALATASVNGPLLLFAAVTAFSHLTKTWVNQVLFYSLTPVLGPTERTSLAVNIMRTFATKHAKASRQQTTASCSRQIKIVVMAGLATVSCAVLWFTTIWAAISGLSFRAFLLMNLSVDGVVAVFAPVVSPSRPTSVDTKIVQRLHLVAG